MKPMEIAREYFSRMRNRDLRVFELFHDDAILNGLGERTSGKAEIHAIDLFEIDEGLIRSLTYFIASHTAGPSDD
jgi:hypothetical protein